MLDIFSSFATDEAAEVSGSWVEFGGSEKPVTKLLIARMNNAAYYKAIRTAVELHREELAKEEKAGVDTLDKKIVGRAMAETILLGWENVSYKGQPLPYSVDNAEKVLQHKDFREAVMAVARNADNYRVKEEAEELKN